MEEDIELIYKCILEKSWNNKVQFEIILDKVTDKRLVVGLLSDIAIRPKQYNASRDLAVELSTRYLNEDNIGDSNYIRESNTYYRSLMRDWNNKELDRHKFIKDALFLIKDMFDSSDNMMEIEDFLSKEENKKYLPELKNILLEGELYEAISTIDKYI
jgi:hypothetical protein